MSNNLDVTLNKSTTPWYLDIDQNGNANHVSRSPDTQTIMWKLTGNAAAGTFHIQRKLKPGFAWIKTPPPGGIFGAPVRSQNGKEITMDDRNNSASTSGEWIYQLSATIGGHVYQSGVTSIIATTTDPTIKNT